MIINSPKPGSRTLTVYLCPNTNALKYFRHSSFQITQQLLHLFLTLLAPGNSRTASDTAHCMFTEDVER